MRVALVATFGLFVAASPLPAQADSAAAPPRAPRSSSTLITEDDIEHVRASVANAYDVVKLLRPRWLRVHSPLLPQRGGTGVEVQYQVFVNDHEMGGLEFLKAVPADQIYTMQFMSVAEVGARYGPGSGPGIIVKLR